MLLSLDDPMLPFPFLMGCISSYSGSESFTDCQVNENELISPLLAPDETLKQFPKTKIFIANNDPIRDHSYRLHLRLL
jgi:acetyl esterase/lipase